MNRHDDKPRPTRRLYWLIDRSQLLAEKSSDCDIVEFRSFATNFRWTNVFLNIAEIEDKDLRCRLVQDFSTTHIRCATAIGVPSRTQRQHEALQIRNALKSVANRWLAHIKGLENV